MALARMSLGRLVRLQAAVAYPPLRLAVPRWQFTAQVCVAARRKFSQSSTWRQEEEMKRQELAQLVTKMQLTYTCKVCNTRQRACEKIKRWCNNQSIKPSVIWQYLITLVVTDYGILFINSERPNIFYIWSLVKTQ
jgi:hypothetical protein